MLHVERWSENKPRPLAMLAMKLAFDAECCFECAEQIKKEEGFIFKLNSASLDEWLSLYEDRHRTFNLFRTTFNDSRGLVDTIKSLGTLFRELIKIKRAGEVKVNEDFSKLNSKEKATQEKIDKKMSKRINATLDKLYKFQIQDIQANINDEKDSKLNEMIKKDIDKPEIRFLLQVYTPCLLIYKHFPSKLLREARKGKIKYIEKLIRLDRSVIHDKKIANFIHKKRSDRMIKDKIASAMANGINEKVTREKMKKNIAGLISFFSSKVCSPFNEKELRDLFDAIAKDKGQGDIDTDIPDSSESFAKAIQRERKNWEDAFNGRSFI